eukprot:c19474_g1_i2 orf=133-2253(+)
MASVVAWSSSPRTPDLCSQSLLPWGAQVCRVPRRKRSAIICRNAQETTAVTGRSEDGRRLFEALVPVCGSPDGNSVLPQATTLVRSTTIFMLASFVLGVGAASASQRHSGLPSQLPVYACISSTRSSNIKAKVSSVSTISSDVDASVLSATPGDTVSCAEDRAGSSSSVYIRDLMNVDKVIDGDQTSVKGSESEAKDNVQQIMPTESWQDKQGYTMEDNVSDAYEGRRDSAYNEVDNGFVEDQHACTELSEPQMKTASCDKRLGTEGARRGTGEKSAEDKEMEKLFHELGSASIKLTVPLRVVGLRGSVPTIWLKDFMLSQGKRVQITFESQGGLKEIVSALSIALEKKKITPRSILAADIVTIGDSWLQAAVSGGLIQPIENAEHHEWFKRLGPKWQAFLRRDQDGCLSSEGLIWGVPYRWGSMVIAYRKDKLLKNNISGIEDWKDLWKPELRGKIAMVDSPREVVGAVLKSLGASYNAQDFDKDVKGGKAAVKQQFLALQKQVKVFDSVHYLKALGSDDVWVAVGWSSDVIPVAKRMSNIRVVTPNSGVSLWADLWAVPAANSIPTNKIGSRVYGPSPLIHQWFDFCLQPTRGLPFRQGVFEGASPLLIWKEDSNEQKFMSDTLIQDTFGAADNVRNGPEMDTNMIEGMPPKDSLKKSEVLEPLSEKAVADYRWLFSQAAEQDSSRKGVLDIIKQFFKVASKQK